MVAHVVFILFHLFIYSFFNRLSCFHSLFILSSRCLGFLACEELHQATISHQGREPHSKTRAMVEGPEGSIMQRKQLARLCTDGDEQQGEGAKFPTHPPHRLRSLTNSNIPSPVLLWRAPTSPIATLIIYHL